MQEVPLDKEEEERLAGCDYEEWLKAQDGHLAKLQAGRRHRETDHGQGYLEGRWGKDDMMGWDNYKVLSAAEVAAPRTGEQETQFRLDRHLLNAAETGNVHLLQMLVQAGANVDSSNNESFLPAAMNFCLFQRNSEPITESVNATYGYVDAEKGQAQVAVYCWSPLHWAANAGHDRAVSFLVAPRDSGGGGALLNASDWKQVTPLHLAAGAGHTSVVRVLLQAGVDVGANDTSCNTPLHFAVWKGHIEIMHLLLQGGALVDAANKGGFTPLHWAARQNQLSAVKVLLQHGADPRKQTEEDLAPISFAESPVSPCPAPVRNGEEALASNRCTSCCTPQGHDQTREKCQFLFFSTCDSRRSTFPRPATTPSNTVAG